MSNKKQMLSCELSSVDATDLEGNLANIIIEITGLFEEYKHKGYSNLKFKKYEVDVYDSNQPELHYTLFGDRMETEEEMDKRLVKQKKVEERRKKDEEKKKGARKLRDEAKRKKEFEKFKELQAKFERDIA